MNDPKLSLVPDVLGAITHGQRVSLGSALHAALGIFPTMAYLNQPAELFLVLQSMIDQKLEVQVELLLPISDDQRRRAVFETPRNRLTLTLQAAEAGILHLPIVARPPTQAVRFMPRVRVKYTVPRKFAPLRPPDGGPPASVLSLSPFRLHAFREVNFNFDVDGDELVIALDLAAKTLPAQKLTAQTRWESLWVIEALEKERAQAAAKVNQARQIALGAQYGSAYPALSQAVADRFAALELPLHPGEVRAIAKMLAYTLDEAPSVEHGYSYQQTMWFQRLCQVLAHDARVEKLHRDEIAVKYLLDGLVYDSVLLAFRTLKARVRENLGSESEQQAYALRLLRWLAGQGEEDLSYIYLPLALGGLVVDRIVALNTPDNPWTLLEELREAARGRIKLAAGDAVIIFKMLEKLLSDAEAEIKHTWKGRERR